MADLLVDHQEVVELDHRPYRNLVGHHKDRNLEAHHQVKVGVNQ